MYHKLGLGVCAYFGVHENENLSPRPHGIPYNPIVPYGKECGNPLRTGGNRNTSGQISTLRWMSSPRVRESGCTFLTCLRDTLRHGHLPVCGCMNWGLPGFPARHICSVVQPRAWADRGHFKLGTNQTIYVRTWTQGGGKMLSTQKVPPP